VFCIYLRTNSDLCNLQHKLIGFCNRDEKCLQRGTDWAFINTAVCAPSLKAVATIATATPAANVAAIAVAVAVVGAAFK
jgi:hypothetical protein